MAILYALILIKLMLIMLWPITVSAAVVLAQNPFEEISGIHVLVMSSISTLSGLTALTLRIDQELRKARIKQLPRPILFVAAHMLGSWLAGTLSFAMAQHSGFGVWAQITIIILASFTGAKFVERASESLMNRLSKD